jgi:hypothetical protein
MAGLAEVAEALGHPGGEIGLVEIRQPQITGINRANRTQGRTARFVGPAARFSRYRFENPRSAA